ncbi:MAG: di-heme oxidoredictase family protein [Acidobacteriota bacterium]
MIRRMMLVSTLVLSSLSAAAGPADREHTEPSLTPGPRAVPGEELAGGATTVFNDGPHAFGHAVQTLRRSRWLPMRAGGELFETPWVAPGQATAGGSQRGLGPLYNAVACTDCHFRDGRGGPPRPHQEATGRTATVAPQTPSRAPRIARLRRTSGAPDPLYGAQLNDRGVGVPGEGRLTVRSVAVILGTAGGRLHDLRRLEPTVTELVRGRFHESTRVALRTPPTLVGLGLLESVPAAQLDALSDPDDLDGDGISGRIRRTAEGGVGRFGWKAAQPDLPSQIAAALYDDMGVTSRRHPLANCPSSDARCRSLAAASRPGASKPGGDAVELEELQLDRLALYLRLLAPPARRDWDHPEVLRGREIFTAIGCAACHSPSLKTGPVDEIPSGLPELANHTIRPFTDLLLHDLGPELADPAPEPGAEAGEWRTAPLWGLGLLQTVNGHLELLHDGRARTIPEAILWHGGEAAPARDQFSQLGPSDREALLRFLSSL